MVTKHPSEARLDALLVRMCRRRGVMCVRMTGETGIPDRLIVGYNGWQLWVELKAEAGRLNAAQRAYHHQLTRRGQHVVVARGEGGIRDVVARIDAHLEQVTGMDASA